MQIQPTLFQFDENGRHPALLLCTAVCVAIILESDAALHRLQWRRNGRIGMIREILRGYRGKLGNRRGITPVISAVLNGDYPMSPEFRNEVERLRPLVAKSLPFKEANP